MKRVPLICELSVLAVVLSVWPIERARADDETVDTSIKVTAPLDAANCSATPPTISVLSLSVDVSKAAFNPGESKISGPLTATNCSATPPTITVLGLTIDVSVAAIDGGDGSTGGCAGLVVGNTVEVELASAGTPLAATAVSNQGDGGSESGLAGPLEAIDTTGLTVTVLSLKINVASASFEDGGSLGALVLGQFVEVSLDASQLPNLVGTQLEAKSITTCATLVVGNLVQVKLSSDTLDSNGNLDATEVDQRGQGQQGWDHHGWWDQPGWGGSGGGDRGRDSGGDGGGSGGRDGGGDGGGGQVVVQAPVQSFNSGVGTCGTTNPGFCDNAPTTPCTAPTDCATAPTITVLGLTIDVSHANLGGCDDNSGDGNTTPIDFTKLMVGQFVEMRLASNQPPLSATEVRVLNFANQVEVEVDNRTGTAVSDSSDDVSVQVSDTVVVQSPAAAGRTKRVRKVLTFKMNSNGRFILAGLPTGSAKILVQRTASGATAVGRKSVKVKGNTTGRLRVRLSRSR
jgi:hypothetical protein